MALRCTNETTLWFAVGGGFQLHDCVDVTVSRCTIDYLATLSQGTVVELHHDTTAKPPAAYVVADFDARFLLPDPNRTPFFRAPNAPNVKIAFWGTDGQ